jgi:hypothetical protein
MQADEVIELIFTALRRADDLRVNDVTMEKGQDGQMQLVLTTEDEKSQKQVWVLDEKSVLQSESESKTTQTLFSIECRTGCSCCSGENFYMGFYRDREVPEEIVGRYRQGIGSPLGSQYAPYGVYQIYTHDAEFLPDGRFIVSGRIFAPDYLDNPRRLDDFDF